MTKSSVGWSDVIGEMELSEGAAFQLQSALSAKRTETYLAQPVVGLEGLTEKLGVVGGAEVFGDMMAFLELSNGPFHRIGGFGNMTIGFSKVTTRCCVPPHDPIFKTGWLISYRELEQISYT